MKTSVQVAFFLYCFVLAEIPVLNSLPLRSATFPLYGDSGYQSHGHDSQSRWGDFEENTLYSKPQPFERRQINSWLSHPALEFSKFSEDPIEFTHPQPYVHLQRQYNDEGQNRLEPSSPYQQITGDSGIFSNTLKNPGPAINNEAHIMSMVSETEEQQAGAGNYVPSYVSQFGGHVSLDGAERQYQTARDSNIIYGSLKPFQKTEIKPEVKNFRSTDGLPRDLGLLPNELKMGYQPKMVEFLKQKLLADRFYSIQQFRPAVSSHTPQGTPLRYKDQRNPPIQNPLHRQLTDDDQHLEHWKRSSGDKEVRLQRRPAGQARKIQGPDNGRMPSLYLLGGAMGR